MHPLVLISAIITFYTRDEKQAVLLAHSLLAALPKDTSLQFLLAPSSAESPDTEPINLQHMLLARIKETAAFVVDGLEDQLSKKAPRIQRTEGERENEDGAAKYTREREELLARKGDIVFEGEEYRAWRKRLQSVMSEVDGLYLKYLKVNCE